MTQIAVNLTELEPIALKMLSAVCEVEACEFDNPFYRAVARTITANDEVREFNTQMDELSASQLERAFVGFKLLAGWLVQIDMPKAAQFCNVLVQAIVSEKADRLYPTRRAPASN